MKRRDRNGKLDLNAGLSADQLLDDLIARLEGGGDALATEDDYCAWRRDQRGFRPGYAPVAPWPIQRRGALEQIRWLCGQVGEGVARGLATIEADDWPGSGEAREMVCATALARRVDWSRQQIEALSAKYRLSELVAAVPAWWAKQVLVCPVCGSDCGPLASGAGALVQHVIEAHAESGARVLACPECEAPMLGASGLEAHWREAHERRDAEGSAAPSDEAPAASSLPCVTAAPSAQRVPVAGQLSWRGCHSAV